MNIVVYGDESGTHDLSAKQPGSKVAILAGYAGFAEDWVKFNQSWQSTLNQYRVPYFHFREYANKGLCKKQNSPYFGWEDQQRHDYLFDLAKIAGDRVRFPFASVFNLAEFRSAPGIRTELGRMGLTGKQIEGPHLIYTALFHEFFDIFLNELTARMPDFNDQISFVFERKDGDGIWGLAANQMFDFFASKDPRFKDIKFSNREKENPLQAADMIAFRSHQIYENMHRDKKSHIFAQLDYALFGCKDYEDFKKHYSAMFGKDLPQLL